MIISAPFSRTKNDQLCTLLYVFFFFKNIHEIYSEKLNDVVREHLNNEEHKTLEAQNLAKEEEVY